MQRLAEIIRELDHAKVPVPDEGKYVGGQMSHEDIKQGVKRGIAVGVNGGLDLAKQIIQSHIERSSK
jgi:hypothetical protein